MRKSRATEAWAVRGFLLAWAAWGLALGWIRVREPGLTIGFRINDAHVLLASDWFARHGHWGTLLVPPRFTAPMPDGSWKLYNTFPPGVFWLHELRVALGCTELWQHRVGALAWNHGAVLVFFLLVRRVTGSGLIAAVAAGLYMFSGPYATASGGLWEHAPMLSLFATLLAWWRFERARTPRARGLWLIAAVACFALDNWLTVQHALMVGVIVAARGVCLVARGFRARRGVVAAVAGTILMLSVPAGVLGVRFLIQARNMGGWRDAVGYFASKAEDRMGLDDAGSDAPSVWVTLAARCGLPFDGRLDSRSLQGIYPFLYPAALCGAAFLLISALPLRRSAHLGATRRAAALGAILLTASLTWPAVFPQHAANHPFTILMLMPGAAVLAAALATLPVFAARAAAPGRRPWMNPLRAVAAVAVAAGPIWSLRFSEAMNAVVALDGRVRDKLAERKAADAADRLAVPFLREAEILEIPRNPTIAYRLGLPFRQLEASGPRPPGEGPLVVALPTTSRRDARLAATVAARWGLPRLLAAPGDLVFYGGGTGLPPEAAGTRPELKILPGLTWREVAFAPTLERRAWVCQVLLTGPGAASIGSVALRVSVYDGDSRLVSRVDQQIAERALSARRAVLASVQVTNEAARDWGSVVVDLVRGTDLLGSVTLRRPTGIAPGAAQDASAGR